MTDTPDDRDEADTSEWTDVDDAGTDSPADVSSVADADSADADKADDSATEDSADTEPIAKPVGKKPAAKKAAVKKTAGKPSGKKAATAKKSSLSQASDDAESGADSAAKRAGKPTEAVADGGKDKGSKDKGTGKQISITLDMRLLVAVLLVAALVGVGFLGWNYYRDKQRLDAFDDVKGVSETFVLEVLTSMNSANVGNFRDKVLPMTTSPLRESLADQPTDGFEEIANLDLQVTADIRQVSVESFGHDTARTTVFTSVTGTSSLAPQGGRQLGLIILDLKKEDGQWLVSSLSDGSSEDGEGGTGVPGLGDLPGAGDEQAPEGEQPPLQSPAPEGDTTPEGEPAPTP